MNKAIAQNGISLTMLKNLSRISEKSCALIAAELKTRFTRGKTTTNFGRADFADSFWLRASFARRFDLCERSPSADMEKNTKHATIARIPTPSHINRL